tara:strand:- start:828 stop:1967 length:1140 start_codon:yes stop_codon:yes gene_type:complete
MTIEQIILIFKDVAARHKQVNGFKVAEDYNFGVMDDNDYPALLLTPANANLPRDENGFSMFTTDFELKVVDLVNDDLDNKIHVFSDSIEILKDIVNEFNTHEYYIDLGLDIISDASFSKLDGFTDSDLYGYGTELTIASPNKLSFCTAPISNLSGFNFTPAAVTVTDGLVEHTLYPSDTYTCEVAASPTEIAYQQIPFSNNPSSQNLYDEYWQFANGILSRTQPVYPTHVAELDYDAVAPHYTLKNNNSDGNLNRFTDENGLQVYSNSLIVDHLYNVMYWGVAMVEDTQPNQIAAAQASTNGGYSDWYLASMPLLQTIRDYTLIPQSSFPAIFTGLTETTVHTSTYRPSSSNIMYVSNVGQVLQATPTQLFLGIMWRKL